MTAIRGLWCRLMHVVWATDEESARFSRVDDELTAMGL